MRPDSTAIALQLATRHHDAGRYAEAEAICRQILAARPDNLAALRLHSATVLKLGKRKEAMELLRRAAEVDARSTEGWQRLADLCFAEGRFADAAAAWARIAALDPSHPFPRIACGWAFHQDLRLTEAEEQYRAALFLDPSSLEAHLKIGDLHMSRGDMKEAESDFRSALRTNPNAPLPLVCLAMLLGGKLPASDVAAIEKWLADPKLPGQIRPHLLFGLANIFDERGDYRLAAESARQANEMTLAHIRPEDRGGESVQHEQIVDRFIQIFDRDFFSRLAGAGNPTDHPVFVFGLPRSGTTLVEQVLASHSAVHGAGELRLAEDLFLSLPEVVGRQEHPVHCIPYIDRATVARLADRYQERLRELNVQQRPRIVDKMPHNYLYVGLLAAVFPKATFIHCRRDFRDVAVSCWLADFRGFTWANDIDCLAERFKQYVRIMKHWRDVLPVTIHEVNYESMVGDLESNARRLIAACGLEWEDACLNFHSTRRLVRTHSATQVRQPIYNRSIGRWKNYEADLAVLFDKLPRSS
jgi:Flp pilus assembly protein TadD